MTIIKERYKHWSPKVMWILRFWFSLSKTRAILKEECPSDPDAIKAAKLDRYRRFFFAACEMWHSLEAVSSSRHKSWHVRNWVLVLARQIKKHLDARQASNEVRSARITCTRAICWRPSSGIASRASFKVERGERMDQQLQAELQLEPDGAALA